jgi:isoamylase/glycogen operon protein
MKTPQTYVTHRGTPTPLGASQVDNQINFALFSQKAEGLSLCLFTPGSQNPFVELPLNPKTNRTGFVWHIAVEKLPAVFDWGFKVFNKEAKKPKILSDPYAKKLNSPSAWGSSFYSSHAILGEWAPSPSFNWENDAQPHYPLKDLIIYEMHVRAFTQDPSSHVKYPGSFLGLIEKIPYLKELGINAVELLPIFEFDESENLLKNPKTGKKLCNFWGYSTLNFFSVMKRYSHSSDPVTEFKMLVKELHKNKIEVILDVVYNHTAEGNENGRVFSFRGIDDQAYYILGPKGEYYNFSGCGNTFNCNNPVVSEFILDSLRYWASEMHVDGFRFDLASILTRDPSGAPLPKPPIIELISKDPILADCKLIAEAWDAAGLYQVGSFPSFGRWTEWNGKYRDVVRRFIKGTEGQAGDFSEAICGSQNIYGFYGTPCHSVNFVIAHDGFTLKDLVSYNDKHNEENGESNNDGTSDNASWNCGQEGETTNTKILQLRDRQMRNLHAALMVSLGIPMVWMGDEYGHTRKGNNNAWSHDNELNWFQWNLLPKAADFHRFYTKMIAFRKTEPLLRRCEFLKKEDIDWHGHTPFQPNWDPSSRFVAYTLKDFGKEEHLYIAFNSESARPTIQLPDPPAHKKWYRIVDTALASPNDFIEEPDKAPPLKTTYKMEAYSALIAKAL